MNRFGLPREIPAAVRRLVRRRCRYGCVVCGAIPYDYDHFIVPYADCTEHDPNDIILLCQNHHRRKHAGLISNEHILHCLQNAQDDQRESRLQIETLNANFKIEWSAATFENCGACIILDGEKVFELVQTGNPREPIHISACLRDSRSQVICRIQQNEIVTIADNIGDFECTSNRLLFRESGGTVSLEIVITDQSLLIKQLDMLKDDCFVRLDGKRLLCGNSAQTMELTDATFKNAEAAICIEPSRFRNVLKRKAGQILNPPSFRMSGARLDVNGGTYAVFLAG